MARKKQYRQKLSERRSTSTFYFELPHKIWIIKRIYRGDSYKIIRSEWKFSPDPPAKSTISDLKKKFESTGSV